MNAARVRRCSVYFRNGCLTPPSFCICGFYTFTDFIYMWQKVALQNRSNRSHTLCVFWGSMQQECVFYSLKQKTGSVIHISFMSIYSRPARPGSMFVAEPWPGTIISYQTHQVCFWVSDSRPAGPHSSSPTTQILPVSLELHGGGGGGSPPHF